MLANVTAAVVSPVTDETPDPAVLTADNRRAAFSPAWGAALRIPAQRALALRTALHRAACRVARPGEATRTPAVVQAEQRAILADVFGADALVHLAWGELLFAADMCLTFAASPRRDPLAVDVPREVRLAPLPGTPDPAFRIGADVFARYRVAREDLLAACKVLHEKGQAANAGEVSAVTMGGRELAARAKALGELWGRRIPVRYEAEAARAALMVARPADFA